MKILNDRTKFTKIIILNIVETLIAIICSIFLSYFSYIVFYNNGLFLFILFNLLLLALIILLISNRIIDYFKNINSYLLLNKDTIYYRNKKDKDIFTIDIKDIADIKIKMVNEAYTTLIISSKSKYKLETFPSNNTKEIYDYIVNWRSKNETKN